MDRSAVSHIFLYHPVVKESEAVRLAYYRLLMRYLKMGAWKSKHIASALSLYKAVLTGQGEVRPIYGSAAVTEALRIIGGYRYFLFFDFFAVVGYRPAIISQKNLRKVWDVMLKELRVEDGNVKLADDIRNAVYRGKNCWNTIKRYKVMKEYKQLVDAVKMNVSFVHSAPAKIAVIAARHEGRERFINMLTGKRLKIYQPDTSRIIMAKPYEDGFVDRYFTGGYMLTEEGAPWENGIYISTYFAGKLGGMKLEVLDIPDTDVLKKLKNERCDVTVCMTSGRIGNSDRSYLNKVTKCADHGEVILAIEMEDAPADWDEWRNLYLKEAAERGLADAVICPLIMSESGGDVSKYYMKYFPLIRINSPSEENAETPKYTGAAYVMRIIKKILENL